MLAPGLRDLDLSSKGWKAAVKVEAEWPLRGLQQPPEQKQSSYKWLAGAHSIGPADGIVVPCPQSQAHERLVGLMQEGVQGCVHSLCVSWCLKGPSSCSGSCSGAPGCCNGFVARSSLD